MTLWSYCDIESTFLNVAPSTSEWLSLVADEHSQGSSVWNLDNSQRRFFFSNNLGPLTTEGEFHEERKYPPCIQAENSTWPRVPNTVYAIRVPGLGSRRTY